MGFGFEFGLQRIRDLAIVRLLSVVIEMRVNVVRPIFSVSNESKDPKVGQAPRDKILTFNMILGVWSNF